MIKELTELHKNPVSFFMLGTEQGLYELFLYNKYLQNKLDITVFDFDKKYFSDILDLPSYGSGDLNIYCALHFLFQDVNSIKNIDKRKFIDRIQELYFNKTFCYRGDFLNFSYKELTDQLNIKFAVSNYQENLARRYFKLEKIKKSIKYFAKYLPFYKSY